MLFINVVIFSDFSVMDKVNEMNVAVTSDVEDEESNESIKNDQKTENEMNATDRMVQEESCGEEHSNTEHSESLDGASDLDDFDSIQNRVVNIVSLNELGGSVLIQWPSESFKFPKSGIWYVIKSIKTKIKYLNLLNLFNFFCGPGRN